MQSIYRTICSLYAVYMQSIYRTIYRTICRSICRTIYRTIYRAIYRTIYVLGGATMSLQRAVAADTSSRLQSAAAADTSSLSDSTDFFLFLTFCSFSLTVGESSESASVAPPSRNLAGMPACRRGGRADREGSGGLAIIVAKYNRAPGNRDVAGRRVRAWSLRFLTHPDVKN